MASEVQTDPKNNSKKFRKEAEATFVINLLEHTLEKTRKVPKNTMLSKEELE